MSKCCMCAGALEGLHNFDCDVPLYQRLASLEARIERLECENGILKRALGWELIKDGLNLYKVADPLFLVEAGINAHCAGGIISKGEREILERKP